MIVTALVVPFVVGIVLMLFRGDVPGRLAALVGAAAMATSLVLFALVWDGPAGISGEVDTSWIKPLRAHFHVGATSLSWPFLLMTAFLGLLCCIWLVADDTSPAVVGLVLIISASSLGVFASLDLLLFFVFFELALIPMWFLIAWWGDPHDPAGRRLAATRFLLFTVSGSALLLVGIVIVAVQSKTLQIFDVTSGSVVAASLIAIGFAVKTPLVPLHTWLPDAHSKAPTVGSVLLAGVFLKLGTYGLLFLGSGMLHDPFGKVAPYLAVAGVVGIVWSALACYAQDDLKRLIAYSSIGHMGFVVLAISTQSVVGVAAAVVGSVAHGLITGLLFFLSGSLKERFGTASMTAIGRGLYARTPWLAVSFVFAAVASLGLPGLAGFWGELLSLRSAYEVGDVLTKPGAWTLLGFAVLGIALTTAYFVRAIRLIAQGEPTPHDQDRDLGGHEVVVSIALAASILVLGLAPGLIVGLYDTAVIRMIPIDWTVVGPAVIVAGGALIALLVDAFYPRRTWLGSGLPSTIALAAAGLELLRTHGPNDYVFALSVIVLAGTLFVVVASNVMNFENAMPPGEYHFLLLSSAAGGLMMVAARDLVTLIVAFELLSLPSIALVGLRQGDRVAIRSAWTFFLASVVSTAITLMGVSLLYGVTGTLDYSGMRHALRTTDLPDSVVAVAVVLTVVGLLFKLGAVPFHVWIPDTYTGSSVMVAGYLSAVSKAAALGAVLILLATALPPAYDTWQPLVAIVAAITMTIGNLGALRQRNAIGLLAWSSIAQAGFLLAPAAALFATDGLDAPVQYLAVYVLANLVAFAALAVIVRLRGSTTFEDLTGLARTDPWMGIPLGFALLTLAGFPPAVIGLVTKYVVLRPVIDGGHTWLAVVMALNVMLGLAYYLRLIAVLVDRADGEPYVSPSPPLSVRLAKAMVIVGALGLVVLSAWPDLLLSNLP